MITDRIGLHSVLLPLLILRESSFNMTRGGDEDIEGGLRKFLDTRKESSEKFRGGGPSENLYTLNPKGVGGGGSS